MMLFVLFNKYKVKSFIGDRHTDIKTDSQGSLKAGQSQTHKTDRQEARRHRDHEVKNSNQDWLSVK